MATQNDDAVCDVQFSLRVPKSMADEISARSQADGMKPASWIRKAISAAIISMDEKVLNSSKSDLLKLLENDKDVQNAILKIAGIKETDRDKMKEMEGRFKRLRKITENKLDDLTKQKKSIQKDILSAEKEINSLTADLEKLRVKGDDEKGAEIISAKLIQKNNELNNLQKSSASLDTDIENAKSELAAFVADAERAKVLKKWDSIPSAGKKAWQDDLEKLEIIEKMEDD